MSEQTNVEVVHQAYAAFGRGDIPAVLSALTDDVEWTLQGPPVIPWAGTPPRYLPPQQPSQNVSEGQPPLQEARRRKGQDW